MSETYIPRRREGKLTISKQTGYDKFGKPILEHQLVTAQEIEELHKKAIPFEIITEREENDPTS